MLTFYKYLDGTITSKLFKKQSDEKISIKADFTNAIEGTEAFEAASEVKVYDSDDVDVTSTIIDGTPTVSSPTITAKVKAGTDGETYKLTFKAVTTNHTYELDIYMIIEDV